MMDRGRTLLCFWLWISFLVPEMGCTHAPLRATEARRGRLFPNGIYQHQVQVQWADDGADVRNFSFAGVVNVRPDSLQVVGLSPFGTTLFKMTESQPEHRLQSEIYVAALKKYAPRLEEYVPLLREIMYAPLRARPGVSVVVDARDDHQRPTRMTLIQPDKTVVVTLGAYDENDFARTVEMTERLGPTKIVIKVKVTEYAP